LGTPSRRSRILSVQGAYDDRLVRMVGLLAAVIGTTLVLAAGSAPAFAGLDTWDARSDRIARVEVGFIAPLAGTSRMSVRGPGE
jgi:hypothetical protein